MSEIKTRTFGHTAAALIVFDSTVAQRARAWETAETVADIDAAERADTDALRPVQVAFHKDTHDINRLESCMRMDVGALRKLAKGSAPVDVVRSDVADAGADPDDADAGDTPAPR